MRCSYFGCGLENYAKGFCRKHYLKNKRSLKRKFKCLLSKCLIKMETKNSYCSFHKKKIDRLKKRGLPITLKNLQLNLLKGKNNHNWNGGVSEYPSQNTMKKNRFIKLQQTKGMCEICGNRACKIHHKDENKSNHEMTNLAIVCNQCHGLLHKGEKRNTSIYIRIYGMTLQSMADRFGGSGACYWKMHKNGTLKNFLKYKI